MEAKVGDEIDVIYIDTNDIRKGIIKMVEREPRIRYWTQLQDNQTFVWARFLKSHSGISSWWACHRGGGIIRKKTKPVVPLLPELSSDVGYSVSRHATEFSGPRPDCDEQKADFAEEVGKVIDACDQSDAAKQIAKSWDECGEAAKKMTDQLAREEQVREAREKELNERLDRDKVAEAAEAGEKGQGDGESVMTEAAEAAEAGEAGEAGKTESAMAEAEEAAEAGEKGQGDGESVMTEAAEAAEAGEAGEAGKTESAMAEAEEAAEAGEKGQGEGESVMTEAAEAAEAGEAGEAGKTESAMAEAEEAAEAGEKGQGEGESVMTEAAEAAEAGEAGETGESAAATEPRSARNRQCKQSSSTEPADDKNKKPKETAGKKKRRRTADDDDEEHEVEEILDVRQSPKGATEYFVKWKNYASSDNSWVHLNDLTNCNELLAEFTGKFGSGSNQTAVDNAVLRVCKVRIGRQKFWAMIVEETGNGKVRVQYLDGDEDEIKPWKDISLKYTDEVSADDFRGRKFKNVLPGNICHKYVDLIITAQAIPI